MKSRFVKNVFEEKDLDEHFELNLINNKVFKIRIFQNSYIEPQLNLQILNKYL